MVHVDPKEFSYLRRSKSLNSGRHDQEKFACHNEEVKDPNGGVELPRK